MACLCGCIFVEEMQGDVFVDDEGDLNEGKMVVVRLHLHLEILQQL